MKWFISTLSGILVVVVATFLLMNVLPMQSEKFENLSVKIGAIKYGELTELNRAFKTTYNIAIDNSGQYIINGKPYNTEDTRIFLEHRIGEPNNEINDIQYEGNGIRRAVIYKSEYHKIVVNIDAKSKPLTGFRCTFTLCPYYQIIEEFPWTYRYHGSYPGILEPDMPNKVILQDKKQLVFTPPPLILSN